MYYITEIQHKADGTNNISTVSRSTFASGLSHYYERKSKMLLNEEFPTVSIQLVDDRLEVIEHETITTQYSEDEETA